MKPEDEELRSNLIEKIAKNDSELANTEDIILENLLETTTKQNYNVLEDNALINMLSESKVKSADIQQNKEKSEITTKKLLVEREKYNAVSIRGSIL